jgi:hypothetical protein
MNSVLKPLLKTCRSISDSLEGGESLRTGLKAQGVFRQDSQLSHLSDFFLCTQYAVCRAWASLAAEVRGLWCGLRGSKGVC